MGYKDNAMRSREDNPERYQATVSDKGPDYRGNADTNGDVTTELGDDFSVEDAVSRLE